MSFGYGVVDAITLIQLAWRTYEGAKRACGEHDEMTREVESLHNVLDQLQTEIQNPDSLINKAEDTRRTDIENYMAGCQKYLRGIDSILRKYNSLSDAERSEKKLTRFSQKVRFANGEVAYLSDMRVKIVTYNTAIMMSLHLLSHGSQSRVERQLGELAGSVNVVVAKLKPRIQEGSSMTAYSNDDRSFWRALRRELIEDGCPSAVIHEDKALIKDYVKELGSKGVLDSPNCSQLSLKSYIGIAQTIGQSSTSANHPPDPESFGEFNIEKKSSTVETLKEPNTGPDIEKHDNTKGPPRDTAKNNAQNMLEFSNNGEIAEESRASVPSVLEANTTTTLASDINSSISTPPDQDSTTKASNSEIDGTLGRSSSSLSVQVEAIEGQANEKNAQVDIVQDNGKLFNGFSSSREIIAAGHDEPMSLNEMAERLAFLERLTSQQQNRLDAVSRVNEEQVGNQELPKNPEHPVPYEQKAAEIKGAEIKRVAEIKADTEKKIAEIKGRMIPLTLEESPPEQKRETEIKDTMTPLAPGELSIEQERVEDIKAAQIQRVAEIKADAEQKIAEIKAAMNGTSLSPLSYSLIPDEMKNVNPIKFRDAVGRKFTFPFWLARTWPVSRTFGYIELWILNGQHRACKNWSIKLFCM
jgi:hypothetical protein